MQVGAVAFIMTDEVPTPSLTRWESDKRYYIAWVHQDIFGAWILSSYWGGLGTRLGGEKHRPINTAIEAEKRLASISKLREKHGYKQIIWAPASFQKDFSARRANDLQCVDDVL